MKRIVCLVLALTLALCAALPVEAAKKKTNDDGTTTISGTLKAPWTVKNDSKLYEVNPVIEGENILTGLPSSGEVYTPITLVLDNAGPDDKGNLTAYPHWGVKEADIILQVPNAGVAATKLMAIYTDAFPADAGGTRSGRTGFYPVAKMFDAAFVFYGFPGSGKGDSDLKAVLKNDKDMEMNKKWFNLINGDYSDRIKRKGYVSPHNVSVHINQIHEHLTELIDQGEVTFTPYPFQFTDEPRTEGDSAEYIEIIHRGAKSTGKSNPASYATFTYVPEKGGYIRTNTSGDYIDRNDETGEPIIFTNVIVLRTAFGSQKGAEYVWEKNFMVNSSGAAEIFQNGKYIRGTWSRNKKSNCRLLLTEKTDKKVRELEFQRGKTFIVITNDITEINIK